MCGEYSLASVLRSYNGGDDNMQHIRILWWLFIFFPTVM